MTTTKLSSYWKANKRYILYQARNQGFLDQKHKGSLANYLEDLRQHLMNDFFNCMEFDIPFSDIEQEIYSKR